MTSPITTSPITTRRALLSFAAAGAAAALFSLSDDAHAQAAPIGAIRVEISPLVEQGWGAKAGLARDELARTLVEQLGPAYRRGAGATLVVTLNSMWLASYAGGGGGGKPGDGGASNDYLNSVATLVDRRGRELARYPIMSTELSSSGGAWYRPDVDDRRVQALGRNNALWIARYLGS